MVCLLQVALRDLAHSRPQCGNHAFRQSSCSDNSTRCEQVRWHSSCRHRFGFILLTHGVVMNTHVGRMRPPHIPAAQGRVAKCQQLQQ
jgi:hypothetical protein